MKKKRRKLLAAILAAAMLVPQSILPASAADLSAAEPVYEVSGLEAADVQDVLQGVIDRLDHAEHHKEVHEHGQAAGGGVVAVLLLQAHELFVLLLPVFGVLLLDLVDHRLVGRHAGGVLLLADLQREAAQTHRDGEDDQRPAVAAEEVIHPLQHVAEGGAKKT